MAEFASVQAPAFMQPAATPKALPRSLANPPVILLGGGANALSVARCLGEQGVKVYAINFPTEYVCYSRHATYLPIAQEGSAERAWANYLLGSDSEWLRGAILLACSDPAIQIVAKHCEELAQKFVLDETNPRAQLCMLNKLCTYRAATAAGVTTPKYWVPHSEQHLHELRDELVYPLLVKPELSHEFQKRFVKKFFIANNFVELVDGYRQVNQAGVDVMLVEMLPGGDDLLCSYYTYLDEQGEPLFHFTKRVIRRFPALYGPGSCHITDWIPELIPISLKLFRHVGLRGLANVEYKLDPRDGQLKLIECNARFTAANCLVADSGFDLAMFVYNRLTGRPQQPLERFRVGKTLWYPFDDFLAFRELQRAGKLTLGRWLSSRGRNPSLPYFRWSDPLPTLATEFRRLKAAVGRRLHGLRGMFGR